jgi:hypothetical protein
VRVVSRQAHVTGSAGRVEPAMNFGQALEQL